MLTRTKSYEEGENSFENCGGGFCVQVSLRKWCMSREISFKEQQNFCKEMNTNEDRLAGVQREIALSNIKTLSHLILAPLVRLCYIC